MWRYYRLECEDSDTDLPHVDESWSEDGSAFQNKKKKVILYQMDTNIPNINPKN